MLFEEDEDINCLDLRPFLDRYYSKKYLLNSKLKGDDYMMLVHSNRICVITLAPTHTIILENLEIQNINFQVSTQIDRAKNNICGRRKKGAQLLSPKSSICTIECTNGETFSVRAGITAKLLEVNESLKFEPQLLKDFDRTFIAIVSPRASDFDKQISTLQSNNDFKEILEEKNNSD